MILDSEAEDHVREIVQQEIRTFAALFAHELGLAAGGERGDTALGHLLRTGDTITLGAYLSDALTNATDRLLRGDVQT